MNRSYASFIATVPESVGPSRSITWEPNTALPDFVPFRGLRYRHDDLAAVTAPPYDVIDPDERAVLVARSPHNAVRLLLPEGDYEGAARDLDAWQADGTLELDPEPAFYGYRMDFTDEHGKRRSTSGVIGALALPERAGEGDVLPHERTMPKAKSDRLALLRATRANLDPIWGLTPAAGLPVADADPVAVTTDDLGVQHSLTRITDAETISEIRRVVGSAPLVLADGHHRFETGIAYRNERAETGNATDDDGRIMCLVVELAEHQLWVQPIHRLLTGIAGPAALRAALGAGFLVEDVGPADPERVERLEGRLRDVGGIGLVDASGLALLTPRADAREAASADLPDALHDVASAWFDALAAPALEGVEISFRADAATVAALVGKGAADAAILLPPVTVEQIRTAALAGVRMPQKTTYFAPKPRSGLVYRPLG
ncbi:MAG: DUF1015 family protein [Acidimicrobiia bacterium]